MMTASRNLTRRLLASVTFVSLSLLVSASNSFAQQTTPTATPGASTATSTGATATSAHAQKGSSLVRLARTANTKKSYTEALRLMQDAVAEYHASGPVDRSLASGLLTQLGDMYAANQQGAQAETNYKAALALWSGSSRPLYKVPVLNSYAGFLQNQKRTQESAAMRSQVQQIMKEQTAMTSAAGQTRINTRDLVSDW